MPEMVVVAYLEIGMPVMAVVMVHTTMRTIIMGVVPMSTMVMVWSCMMMWGSMVMWGSMMMWGGMIFTKFSTAYVLLYVLLNVLLYVLTGSMQVGV